MEILVARYILGGYCDKETARLLRLSFRTIHTHRLNARKKLGVQTRRDFFVAARERGIQAV